MLRGQLPPLQSVVGKVVVCEVDLPEWDACGPNRYTHVYVAVVTQPEPWYDGDRLAMIVKILNPREAPQTLRDDPPASKTWLRPPPDPTVADVYARNAFRVHAKEENRPAVQVGRQLVSEGLLVRHSTSRSSQGTRWAEAVGGTIPPLEEEVVDSGFAEAAERALTTLGQQQWWQRL